MILVLRCGGAGPADGVRALGAPHRPPDPRRHVLQEPPVLRGVGRGDARVLRHVRRHVLRHPVPAVRAGVLGAEVGRRLLPIAASLMVAAPLSAKLVGRLGTKVVVTGRARPGGRRAADVLAGAVTSGYPLVARGAGHRRRRDGFRDGAGHRLDHGFAAAVRGRRRLRGERHDPRDRRRAGRRHPGQRHGRRLHAARSRPNPTIGARWPRRRPRRPAAVSDSVGSASIVAAAAARRRGAPDHRRREQPRS